MPIARPSPRAVLCATAAALPGTPAWAATPALPQLGIPLGLLVAAAAFGLWCLRRRTRHAAPATDADMTLFVTPSPEARPYRPKPPRPAARPAPAPQDPVPVAPAQWSLQVIRALEWKRFEELCAAFYREKGIRNHATPLGILGGPDLRLLEDDGFAPTAIVLCRSGSQGPARVETVREMFALRELEAVSRGFILAAAGFTPEARALAQSEGVGMIDGRLLLAMIQRLPAEAQQRLWDFATRGDYTTPTCPHCGIKMVPRQQAALPVWVCRQAPDCTHTFPATDAASHPAPQPA